MGGRGPGIVEDDDMTEVDAVSAASSPEARDGGPGLRVTQVVGTIAGGTARHVRALVAGGAGLGIDMRVAGPSSARAVFEGTGVPFAVAEIGDRPDPVRDGRVVARLRRLLAQARPEVVHAHGLRAGAFAAVALAARPGQARGPRPALVVTVHNAPPDGRAAAAVYRGLELVVARRATVVLGASGDLIARMRGLRARETGQAVVAAPQASPPAPAAVATARAELRAGGRPVLLVVARLTAQKGLDVLLEAAAAWQDLDPAPVLVLAGDGPQASELAVRAGVARLAVRFLGERDDVPALLAAADVVVVPSRWEARALIVQEALRAGRPIVATRVGGIPDLTGEDGAMLVPASDAGALSRAVTAVLSDPELAARLRAAAGERARALPSEADSVAAAAALYERLAARAPQRA
jgi:glycosyltransferase involved in cell wall biosynthesis